MGVVSRAKYVRATPPYNITDIIVSYYYVDYDAPRTSVVQHAAINVTINGILVQSIYVNELYITCRLIRVSTFFSVPAIGTRLRYRRHFNEQSKSMVSDYLTGFCIKKRHFKKCNGLNSKFIFCVIT